MGGEQAQLRGPVADGPASQRDNARDVQGDAFKQQQREKQVGLVAVQQPGRARARARLRVREGKRASVNVGVRVLGVGMGVVRSCYPPTIRGSARYRGCRTGC